MESDKKRWRDRAPTVDEILRGSAHALTIFSSNSIEALPIFLKGSKPYIKCYVSGKDRPAKPEEIVRQLYLRMLVDEYGYPADRVAIEKPVQMGSNVHDKPADIVIWDEKESTAAYIIIECKKPKRSDGLEQLKSYCNAEGSPIGVWTNGGETIHLHRRDPNYYQNLPDIPKNKQSLSDLLGERWTLDDLANHNVLVREQTTLKQIILDMENLVLANAGVDAFDEVFKLIYTKLYDEMQAARGGSRRRFLQFRCGGATPTEFKDKMNRLFARAQGKWPGVFLAGEEIDLTPEHLVTCASYLENVKLFNSNLQVIDEAFEYLSVEVGKAKKGQYFTPRHVIDMAVKMLNPTVDEHVIDTAAGSCGFTVHSIFHVWGHEFTARGPEKWQAEYASSMVYAIDFDPRSIKIATALNLIAGDGRTNVYCANTLDPRTWSEEVKVGLRPKLQRFPKDRSRDQWNKENFRHFDFDVLVTNPPFAGDIQDSRILHQFDLGKRPNGKWQTKVGRDVLFIERNLEFLRPGGRMAIVLPQGRLNNVSERYIRDFVHQHARLLASVSLDIATFKPHTNTKTSILFLQKWNDNPHAPEALRCPRVEDYPVFFAVSQKAGKDSTGEYVFLKDETGARVHDPHGHPIVDHDLYNLRTHLEGQIGDIASGSSGTADKMTTREDAERILECVDETPGIAEAFRDWGKSQGLGFCQEDHGVL